MKRKIIIGIHGIGNKPPQRLLQLWWQKAICEGLERIGQPQRHFKFVLVYWAQFMYSEPQDINIKDPRSPLYIENPYFPAKSDDSPNSSSSLRKKILDLLEIIMDRLFLSENRIFNFDRIGDYVIRKKFRDMEIYYHKNNVGLSEVGLYARNMIRQELAKILRKHRKNEILLISHSMGTIIAYDVLTQLVPNIKIHTFITLGSPLGLPTIMKKIYSEQHKDFKIEKQLTSPENIQHAWLNFSDLNDRIAMNYNLCDDFKANSSGVGPKDTVVHNDYEHNGDKNPHKSYGYLRSPEVARVIWQFLSEERISPWTALKRLFSKLVFRHENNYTN